MIGSDVVVGVDGGNSKTDVVVCDSSGRVVAVLRGPGTNVIRSGVEAVCGTVTGLVREALRQAEVEPGPVAAGVFHLANLDLPDTEAAMREALVHQEVSQRVHVANDTFAVLRAGSPTEWGIAVVSGAGINACGVAPDGRTARFLAMGEISGDWGGGLAIAIAAVGAAVRAGDGRGPQTVLRDLIPPALGTTSVEQAAVAWSGRTLPTEALHAVPPLVAAAAAAGDPVATGIFHRQASEVVDMVRALIVRLDLHGEPTPVILGGGILQHGPELLRERIESELELVAPSAHVHILASRPVTGSALHALDLAGLLTSESSGRVRNQLRAPVGATA